MGASLKPSNRCELGLSFIPLVYLHWEFGPDSLENEIGDSKPNILLDKLPKLKRWRTSEFVFPRFRVALEEMWKFGVRSERIKLIDGKLEFHGQGYSHAISEVLEAG